MLISKIKTILGKYIITLKITSVLKIKFKYFSLKQTFKYYEIKYAKNKRQRNNYYLKT